MSDLGLPLILLTLGVGYFLKKKQEEKYTDEFQYIVKPNGSNIYTSNTINETTDLMLGKSIGNYKKGQNPYETGFIPPFFNFPQSGKNTSLNDSYIIPPTASQQAEIDNYNKISTFHQKDQAQISIDKMPIFNEGTNLEKENFTNFNSNFESLDISPLTGLSLENAHANMVPFFGSNIKQNMEAFANTKLLDNYTGKTDTFNHKQEVAPLFPRVQQDIYGTTPVTDRIQQERFNVSNFRENERPFEPTRISALHEGSYDIPRINDKTINELRPGNKPRISYSGRTVDNQHSSVRGIVGKIEKHSIDTSFEQTPDMLLKGKSQYLQEGNYKQNYEETIKPTRRSENTEEIIGNPHSNKFGTYQSVILANMDA